MTRTSHDVPPRLALDQISALGAPGSGRLLRAVSFRLMPGRCLAILGSDDDGAALLLDLVCGHASHGNGTIRLDGRAIDRLPPQARGVGLVSARDPLFAHLDVAGNIGFPLRARGVAAGERDRLVRDALALLGLDAVAGLRPSVLGPADRVRAAIARALVAGPSLLLLDAPFLTLDLRERALLQRALRRLVRARGLTVLLSTADRDEALMLGDEIGILDAGTLHQVGAAQDLLDRPADAVVAARIGDANLLPGRIVRCDDETALVRLASGHEMEAEPAGTIAEGAPCMLCVRPDRIATVFLSRPDAGAPGSDAGDALPAVLQEAIHFGDHLRLRFRLADGAELIVRRPPAAAMAELRPDRIALLAWQAHQARVFAA